MRDSVLRRGLLREAVLALAAPATPATAPTARLALRSLGGRFCGLLLRGFALALALALGFGLADFVLGEVFLFVLRSRRRRRHRLRDDRLGSLDRVHLFALLDQERLRRSDRRICIHRDGDLEAALEIAQGAHACG